MDDLAREVASLSIEKRLADIELPAELWLEISVHLGPRDLAAMSLVSRELQGPAHSLLFRSCVFRLGETRRLPSMLSFYTSSHIAPGVQECTVLGFRHNSAAAVAQICAALPHFTNLRRLAFQYVRMTPTTIAGISATAPLSLSLVSCMTDFPALSETQAGTIQLKKFIIHNESAPDFPHDHRWLRIFSLDVLRVLDLALADSTRAFMGEIIHTRGIHLPALEVLQLHLNGLDNFTQDEFVSTLTSFTALRILGVHPPMLPPLQVNGSLTLPGEALPLLASFYGPAKQAAAYCAGRPSMLHLKLYAENDNRASNVAWLLPALLTIGHAAPQLLSLELRIAFAVEVLIPTLTRALPALRSLRVVVPRYPGAPGWSLALPEFEDILSTLAELIPPPHLAVLFLAYRYRGPVARRAPMHVAISELGRRSPALRYICVCCDQPQERDWWEAAPTQNTMLWRWTRDARGVETTAQWRAVAPECIDGCPPRVGIKEVDREGDVVAKALDEEWLEATAAHRRGA